VSRFRWPLLTPGVIIPGVVLGAEAATGCLVSIGWGMSLGSEGNKVRCAWFAGRTAAIAYAEPYMENCLVGSLVAFDSLRQAYRDE